MRKIITLTVLGAAAFLSVSCDTTTGALSGAGAGALLGGIVGHQSGHTAGGAAIGGVTGAAVGGMMGNQNQRIRNLENQNAPSPYENYQGPPPGYNEYQR